MKHTRREFVRVLFVAGQAAAAANFLPGNLLAGVSPPEAALAGLNFLVFGDWGRGAELDQVQVAGQMAKAAEQLKAKFVISVGDNFYENGVVSVEDPQWRKTFEEVYHAPSLQVPWHVILGNHDYHGNCEAQLAYGKTNPRWNMPARYFVQTHRIDAATTADLFYIDTTPMIKGYYKDPRHNTRANVLTQDVPTQLAWLKQALAASQAQWKIVIGHHPIYSGSGSGETPELVEGVLPLLHDYKVQAYFNGHDHNLQHLMAGEVNLFDSGAGSAVSPTIFKTGRTKFAQASSGFIAATLQSHKLIVRMIDNEGKTLYVTAVGRA
jgi:acid phosphatase